MKDEIYLIDGSAYIYRAYHAIAPLTNSKGVATNAVLGFVKMVQKLINEKSPKYLGIAFDAKGPVFRHDLYPEYKANRPPMPDDLREQIPFIKQFVTASNLLMLEESGVEADDILASIAEKYASEGYKVVIVSGDKDLLQLVDDNITMFDPMKNKVMDKAEIVKKYGVRSDQLLDFFALVGDSADNVPGVPGVGPKTAEKLIVAHGSLDGLYEQVDTLKKSKMKDKIIDNRDQAYLSKELIDLKKDVAVPDTVETFSLKDEDETLLAELYTELEFSTLLKGIDTSKKVSTDSFYSVTSEQELDELLAELDQATLLVVDTETTSLNARRATLVGLSLCTSLDKAYYIPLGHLDGDGGLVKGQLDEEMVMARLLPYLQSDKIIKIGHNLKYDYTVLKEHSGIELQQPLADTLIAAYLTETGGRSLKLDDLCQERGLKLTPFSEVVDGDKREDDFAYVSIDKAVNYSCEDVYGTLVLWKELEEKLDECGVAALFGMWR